MPLGQQSTEKFEFILANDLTASATEVGIEQVLSLDVATDGEIGSVGQAFGGGEEDRQTLAARPR